MIYIYGLVDGEGNLFYVGKTQNPRQRLNAHRCKYGKSISIYIIEEVTQQDWEEKERYWIEELRDRGYKLLNILPGGDSPPDCTGRILSDATKEKISKAHIGQRHSDATKQKLSRLAKQRCRMPAYREKMRKNARQYWAVLSHREEASERQKKHCQDPEVIRRLRDATTRLWQDPVYRESLCEIHRKRCQDPAVLEQMSMISKRQWEDPEYRAKTTAAHIGKVPSEDTRRKMSEAHKDQRPTAEAIEASRVAIREKWDTDKEYYNKMSSLMTERWRDPEFRAKMKEINGTAHAKSYPAFIHKETGEIIPAGMNLKDMCQRRGLGYSGMYLVSRGKRKSNHGWMLLGER